ncbi:ferritin-like domain-containing protein [Bradyrhizobium sp. STM 3562]|uniref:ferritin-like domain-containing protein n=1 Tax=Bradyrhizobium sp. STM 3562 TaxID=578924 RepID=UPI00388F8768
MLLSRALLLKSEPAGDLHSLDELFALANAMEQEAANRYAELADEMGRQNKPELAAVFGELAAAERDHVESVTNWSRARLGKAPDPALVRWEAPETFDRETEMEIRRSRLITPYHALCMAVCNEERAFAFWSYLAAFAEDAEIKNAAEAMAREELGHVASLRRERRRAYHREYDAARADAQAEAAAGRITRIDAGALERRLAAYLAELESRLSGAAAGRARELAKEAVDMSLEAIGVGRFPASLGEREAQAIAEALADAYLERTERARDPAQLDSMQSLAARAIARLAWLRSLDRETL